MADDGVVSTEFTEILTDMSRTVSFSQCTKTTDAMTGEETSTFAVASDVSGIFFLEKNRFVWDKEGLLEVGDAYLIVPTSVGATRYDQFTVDGDSYYVHNVTRRTVLQTAMMDFCVLFKVA